MSKAKEFTTNEQQKIKQLLEAGHSFRSVARHLGCHHETVQRYASNRGIKKTDTAYPDPPELDDALLAVSHHGDEITAGSVDRPYSEPEVLDLAQVDTTIWETEKFKVWSSFYRSKDRTTHTKVWHSSLTLRRRLPVGFAEAVQEFLEANAVGLLNKQLPPVTVPKRGPPQMGVFGFWDAHLGNFAWHEETGDDYDTKIATKRLFNATDDLVANLSLYNVQTVFYVVGNDFYHMDNSRGETPTDGFLLDKDTRSAKVWKAGILIQKHIIDRLRRICNDVRVVLIPGNHDETSSWWLCQVLEAHYRETPGITFDIRAIPRKYFLWEQVLLGFAHGHLIQPNKAIGNLFSEAREHISSSTYCEIHTGHKHHREEFELSRVLSNEHAITLRRNPSLASTDAWHYGRGFTGADRMAIAWRYLPHGLAGNHLAWSRDD